MRLEIKSEKKQKIYNAGLSLFAKKGFSATSVRDIAGEAKVNLAMISYYFGGKFGILKMIIDDFFDGIYPLIEKSFSVKSSLESKIREFINEYIDFLRENPERLCAVFNELPYDTPEIGSIKTEKMQHLLESALRHSRSNLSERPELEDKIRNLWHLIFGMINFHFRMRPALKNTYNRDYDDSFYDDFKADVCNFVLYGIFEKKSG